MTLSDLSCLACGTKNNFDIFNVYEQMLGLSDRHEYGQCKHCGSIQNLDPPADLSQYYPSGYYSLSSGRENSLKTWLRTQRALQGIGQFNPIGAVATLFFGVPYFVPWLKQASQQANISLSSAILDVGCGSGTLLHHLKSCGYSNLTGVDPFLAESKSEHGLYLLKKELTKLEKSFDWIMFHHSLEHMSNPLEILTNTNHLLTTDGICLVRIPVAGTWAWQTYGSQWVQLDAPRHLFIPSLEGMKQLVQQANLDIQDIQFDSDRFQFVGSENIRQGKRFYDNSYFTAQQLREFDRKAKQLNNECNGDQACFWLRKKT